MVSETYYVYAYLRNKDSAIAKAGTPYYIGKGYGRRAHQQHRNKINGRGVHTPYDKSFVVFLEKNLTEVGAFAIERRLVRWYGRKDLATGILHNRTDGGEGGTGSIPWSKGKTLGPQSEERRKNISIGNKGKTKGIKRGPQKNPANKKYEEVTCPYCNKVGTGNVMKRFHFNNCKRRIEHE